MEEKKWDEVEIHVTYTCGCELHKEIEKSASGFGSENLFSTSCPEHPDSELKTITKTLKKPPALTDEPDPF